MRRPTTLHPARLATAGVGAAILLPAPFASAAPQDATQWPHQWSLHPTTAAVQDGLGATGSAAPDAGIDVEGAWAFGRGEGQRIGVIDAGVDPTTPDLAGRVVAGAAPAGQNPTATCAADDHGTVVSTVLAGRGGTVAGVAPAATLVSYPATCWGGSTPVADAFRLAGQAGIRVVSASITNSGGDAGLDAAVRAHPDTLFVVAAGNGSGPAGELGIGPRPSSGVDVDASPVRPCVVSAPNVLCVGASDLSGNRAWFSNFGAQSVDLFAPGVAIYASLGAAADPVTSTGTSVATPLVAGTAALVRQVAPALDAVAVKDVLLSTSRRSATLSGLATSGGRLDAGAAVLRAAGLAGPTGPTGPTSGVDDDGTPAATDPAAGGPASGPSAPTVTAPGASPVVVDAVRPVAQVVLRSVRLSRSRVIVCARPRRGCVTRSASLSWRASVARTTAEIRLERLVGRRWRVQRTLRRSTTSTRQRVAVPTRLRGRPLVAGRWRATVRARTADGAWSRRSVARFAVARR